RPGFHAEPAGCARARPHRAAAQTQISHATRFNQRVMRSVSILTIACHAVGGAIFGSASAIAQINDCTSLAEVEFSQTNQPDPNPPREKTHPIQPKQSKHSETDPFNY